MAAYLIVDIANVRDETSYARYRALVSQGIEAAGGRYLARGGTIDVLEGDWRPGRIVVVRFDDAQAARAWWSSSDYSELKSIRQDATTTNMILVDGIAGADAG